MKIPLNHLRRTLSAMLVFAMALGFSAGASAGAHSGAAPAKDIVDTAVANGSFNTLAAALEAAGLVDALKGDGPFTVFAPTDAAFSKLPEGTLENLLKPENKDQLTAILLYHVVPGKIMSGDISGEVRPETLEGSSVDVVGGGSGVTVNGAKVVAADVKASNGVIHVIDTVILPPSAS